MKIKIPIRHPEWLRSSDPQKSISLFLAGKIPTVIAGWMIVVGLKHPLRAVYGSDLRAAWALLLVALADKWKDSMMRLRCWVWCKWHRQPPKAYWELKEIKFEKDLPLDHRISAHEDEVRH